MSYVDRNSDDKRGKALTGGVVALMQVGLGLALVNGFAVAFLPPDKPARLASEFFPTTPMTPDAVEPETQPSEKPLVRETPITAPVTRFTLDPIAPITGVALDPMPPIGGLDKGQDLIAIPPVPSDPPARFTPRGAKPRGDMARWVTTDDYPAADLRAGNTGTVRFRLAIDGAGRVTGCTITQSSGHSGLDAATCRNVAKRARFDAASDAGGATISGTYDGIIRWMIPQD